MMIIYYGSRIMRTTKTRRRETMIFTIGTKKTWTRIT